MFDIEKLNGYKNKWQDILRLRDWDIIIELVEKSWRKTGDIKMDLDDKKAILLINNCDPKQTNIEATIVHELLHLKLWPMDNLTESLIVHLHGGDRESASFDIVLTQYMTILESTVEDLAKGFMSISGEDKSISFGRLRAQVDEEIGGI